MSENGELTLKTYEVATNRLNAVDQWAHNFVNLYFVFCAALIAATGYAVTIDEKNKLYLYPFNSQITARQFFIWGASIIGLLVSAWASTMVLEWFLRRRRIIRQILYLEKNLPVKTPHREWGRFGIVDKIAALITGSVLVLIVVGWSVLLLGVRVAQSSL